MNKHSTGVMRSQPPSGLERTGAAGVSIIVACRNERGEIARFLDSLLSQDLAGIPWEAIVADGCSDDGTREIIAGYSMKHPALRLIDNPGRIVSTGLNAAISAARGDIILRMDAHTLYAPDYCRRCLETLHTTGADNVGGPARTRPSGLLNRAVAAAYHSRFSTGGAKFHDETYEGWADTVPYGCWRKETLQRLGLFDESLVRNQDDELNLRLARAGGRIWQSPQIVSYYVPRSSLTSLFRQYFQYGFWKVAVIRKHRLPASWRHLVPAAFLLIHLLLAMWLAWALLLDSAHRWETPAGLWITLCAAYALILAAASFGAARRNGWPLLPLLPAVFAAYHVSYGMGFLAGLRWLFGGIRPSAAAPRRFTRLSR